MFDQAHLGHQVGPLDQGLRSTAACEHHMGELRPLIHPSENILHWQIAQLQGHVDLIEQHQLNGWIAQINE